MTEVHSVYLQMPWPPSVNAMYRQYDGRTVLSVQMRKWRVAATNEAARWHVKSLGAARVKVSLTLHAADKRMRDIDNCAKAVLDQVQKLGVIDNDHQVYVLLIERGAPAQGGMVEVQVERLGADECAS